MSRILILDDLNFIRQALQAFLEQETDFEIVGQATSGTEALEYLEQTQIDIIIVDLEMPEIDGITLTKIIVRRFPDVKVVIFSSHDDEQNINAAIEAGAKGYISKNTPTNEIVETVHNVRRGYFKLGPGLFEKSFSYLIGQQEFTLNYLQQLEAKHQDRISQLEKKYARTNLVKRQELFNELDFQIDSIKTEFRQGLETFQERVNQQVETGLNELFKLSDGSNSLGREIKKQVDNQNLEYQLYLKNLYLTTKKSVDKLEHQLCFVRYLVIFLAIAYFTEHLIALILK